MKKTYASHLATSTTPTANPTQTKKTNVPKKPTMAKSVSKTVSKKPSHKTATVTFNSANLQPLGVQKLRRYTDFSGLPVDSDHCPAPALEFGQSRACQAILTALDIHANGYHVFAAGENGLGKRTLIQRLLNEFAKTRLTPDDWVYVHNFADGRAPKALQLPAGMGQQLAEDVTQFWLSAKRQLNKRFRSEHYQTKIEAIKNEINAREEQAYDALHQEGKQYSLALALRSSDNKPIFIQSDEIEATGELGETSEEKAQIGSTKAKNIRQTSSQKADKNSNNSFGLHPKTPYVANYQDKNHMQKRLSQLTVALEQIEDEANQTLQALHHSMTRRTLKPLLEPLFAKYQTLPQIVTYLQALHDDIVKHIERIINEDDEDFLPSHFSPVPARYFVNVLVSHTPDSGAPIVFEDLPTHLNLLGHVEQITHLGTVSTDVSLIRAGSLHRANGGYLILEANSLLEYPYAWQGLKRALQSRQIKMSSLEQMLTLTGSISLEPQPIALDVKVILLGEPDLYYDLLDFEPEFNAVFKIRADFHDRVARTVDNEQAMVAKIADMVHKHKLLPFDNRAFASLLDYLSEQAEDQHELSLHGDRLSQVLLEANRHAKRTEQSRVSAEQVAQAIEDMRHRSGYLRQLFWQELEKGQQLISTQGSAVGQVNALTVISYADSEFGMPARLTASIHPSTGHADIIDIERDVDLGGSIHAKGVLIMSSYLRALFAEDFALNFTASLAFEQSYGGIDGDSATVAETCALLSALAQVPLSQHLAVTGSMNQFGQVQAVGGINAKIAGFYDACVEQGLSAENGNIKQGVIIPKANIDQLMLRQDIIDSVNAGKFVIYAVSHINEALTLLTGLSADETTKKGKYRKNSVYGKIYERLALWEAKDTAK